MHHRQKVGLNVHNFVYQASKIWSELPFRIKNGRSFETFMQAIQILVKTSIMIIDQPLDEFPVKKYVVNLVYVTKINKKLY
jgi:hypothetical protein